MLPPWQLNQAQTPSFMEADQHNGPSIITGVRVFCKAFWPQGLNDMY
jgi:hypothetical protein